ncbi:metallophosphoesterase [Virgibacillus doumboii]|uniref:metallophosphoesterase n=1 Tax=Virgibacillus doumboii TaxID=2697503 RepID=UPI0013DF4C4F|nr:metallophosphoesterase [Virgibacillus doumboii]
MKKIGGRILLGILLAFVVLIVYTIWDNNRITITEQKVMIEDLPEQLKGFRILHVTDLHEKEFGNNQAKLIDAINAINYDAIVFTGDMLDSTQSTDFTSFYTLLEGITNKENAWFVPGNTDPYSYQFNPDIEKSEFIKGMEKRGVKLLESIDTAEIDGSEVHFVNFELAIVKDSEHVGISNGVVTPPYESNEKYIAHRKQLWEGMEKIEDEKTVIALNHYPVVDARIDYIKNSSSKVLRDFDLIMAGHYHGGQIRLPFVGALFVPEPWYNNSFFPPKDRVNGLWEYKQMKQYVSTGLGSSDSILFLKFRLFNPPEINLITLERQAK